MKSWCDPLNVRGTGNIKKHDAVILISIVMCVFLGHSEGKANTEGNSKHN